MPSSQHPRAARHASRGMEILRGWEAYMEDERSLVHALACHLIAVQATNASPETVRLYDGRHKQFLTFLKESGHKPPFELELLNPSNVRRSAIWVKEHSRGSRGGESAARALVSTLKTTSAWLADEGYTDSDLCARVRRPRIAAASRTPFSQSEVRELVAAALETKSAARDIAMIHLLLDTGMRVGGLCSILVEDLSIKDRRVELRLKGGRRHTLYFGATDRRDGGRSIRAMRSWLNERDTLIERWPDRHQGRLWLSFDGWPLDESGARAVLHRLGGISGVSNAIPHRFRHTMATWHLIRHPGDETGLRGILGHLSQEMFRTYVHISSELIAQRAGRVALSEAWLGDEADAPATNEARQPIVAISHPTRTSRTRLA